MTKVFVIILNWNGKKDTHECLKSVQKLTNVGFQLSVVVVDNGSKDGSVRSIKKQFKELDVEFVAVRSSATAEDGTENAWAGQLDSFLNTKEENLLENIQKCWASLFTPRAIFYRFEKGLHYRPSRDRCRKNSKKRRNFKPRTYFETKNFFFWINLLIL